VTFHVLNQRNTGRTATTPKVRKTSADGTTRLMRAVVRTIHSIGSVLQMLQGSNPMVDSTRKRWNTDYAGQHMADSTPILSPF
jgi:hypothetical protein